MMVWRRLRMMVWGVMDWPGPRMLVSGVAVAGNVVKNAILHGRHAMPA
jgi:hypothetical protein